MCRMMKMVLIVFYVYYIRFHLYRKNNYQKYLGLILTSKYNIDESICVTLFSKHQQFLKLHFLNVDILSLKD